MRNIEIMSPPSWFSKAKIGRSLRGTRYVYVLAHGNSIIHDVRDFPHKKREERRKKKTGRKKEIVGHEELRNTRCDMRVA